ncbi:hypothetical protein DXG03_000334 [Asterophora parasitica]|uniref:Uncharacterized protein n=1 Tax=Asterophora parasitica TaxID=117018 RepID=A0A9P7GKI9_9AGAR|nr:hypothetical protein DXG03_000334 [Asterophora parasitica]
MRRFAAAFSTKKHPVPPPLLTDHHTSSASDSSGSASVYLHTPDDNPTQQPKSSSWKSWLKSAPKSKHSRPQQDSAEKLWTGALPDWSPPELDDTQSEPSFEDDVDPRQTLLILVSNSLVPPPPPSSPFTRRSDAALLFPRSIHTPSSLKPHPTLISTLFKSRLLARLRDGDRPLTQAEQRILAGLSSRRLSPVIPANPPPHPFDEPAPSSSIMISLSSPGLTRWISRPCFEDRYAVFLPQSDGSVQRHPVTGTALAVAAIEYSEGLESMVDFDLHDTPPPSSSSSLAIEIPSAASEPASSSSAPARNSPYIAVPSPLRNEHNLPVPPPVTVVQSAPAAVPAPAPVELEPLVKRGVRFAEDGKDDVIPLGYALRMKKKREEKARFLRAEQERRVLEEERYRLEEERRVHEARRAELEEERRAWERERRTMEAEKRNRKYAEEVVAMRLRRDSQRAGGVPALKASENNPNAFLGSSSAGYFPTSTTSSASERNKRPPAPRHSRLPHDDVSPPYPPRRETSEPNLPTITRTSPNAMRSQRGSSHSRSPGSSRPSSLKGTPNSNEAPPLPGTHSPSVYSSQELSSSEDVRAAVAAAASRTKPRSFMAHNNSSSSLAGDRATSYPVWVGSSQSLNSMVLPPMPMMPMQMQVPMMPPFVMMDMPLLPPTPPFMMQQYPRQHRSPGGSSGSGAGSSKGRLSNSQNSSRERVNSYIGGGGGGGGRGEASGSGGPPRSASFPRPEYRASKSTPATLHQSPRHSYQPSTGAESRRASMPVSPPRQSQHAPSPRPRQYSHHEQRSPTTPQHHSHSQPSPMSRVASQQHLQPPSPWTGLPTQSGKLPNANVVPQNQHSSSSRAGATKTTASSSSKRQTIIT